MPHTSAAAPVFSGAERYVLKSCTRLEAFLWREHPRQRRSERPLLLPLQLTSSLPSTMVLYLRGAGETPLSFRKKKRECGDGSRCELVPGSSGAG